jgi:CysZ protein
MRPRILAVLLLPMLGAIVLWTVLAWFFWGAWIDGLRAFIGGTSIGAWLGAQAGWLLTGSTTLLVLALLVPAMFVTAVVITELIAMPVIVSVVSRAYPHVERKGGGSVFGSIGNATIAVLVFAVLWIVTLPLWFTGIGALVLPALNSAYLNQRLFRYDALSEHATRDEYRAIVSCDKWRLYGLGLLLAGFYYIPFVNLAAPVISGLAFTHFGLGALAKLRRDRP